MLGVLAASILDALLLGDGLVVPPPPPERLVSTMTTIEIAGLAWISVIGVAVLMRVWSASNRLASNDAC